MKTITFLFAIFCGTVAAAQTFETKSVSLFKNGTAFFHKTATLDASSGAVLLDELPVSSDGNANAAHLGDDIPVLFGSVWFSSANNPLLKTSVFQQEIQEEAALSTASSILQHNLNKTLKFKLRQEETLHQGTLVSLKGETLLVKMEEGWKQISLSSVDYFDFEETPTLTKTWNDSKEVLKLDFEKRQKAVPVDLIYMQKGISWVPNYHFELQGDNRARLSLHANVINDLEDLENVEINFVLGIPSFSFSHLDEPLFSGQPLSSFLANLNQRSHTTASFANVITQQRAYVNRPTTAISDHSAIDDSGNLSKEDLFFYKKEQISLPSGGRMLVQLLETEVTFEDIYSVQLSESFNGRNSGTSEENIVWHSLKFKNNSGLPLSTGTISFVKNEAGQATPVSQSQLNFVPAGQMAKVKMSQVPDISVFDYDKEVERQDRVRNNWDLVTVESTLEVANFKDQEVQLEVEREITGELIKSDYPWESYSIVENLSAFNQKNKVCWDFTLKPGEKRKVTYRYKVLVH